MRAFALVCAVLAVLAAMATAALVGLALFPQEGAPGWGFALVSFAVALGFGALAVKLLD